jgi:hypothetical protein
MKKILDWFRSLRIEKDGEPSVNDTKGKYLVVAHIKASTRLVDDWGDPDMTVHHSYILKENGYGSRKVEIIRGDSFFKDLATKHNRYVNMVKPWELGVQFSGVPTHAEIADGGTAISY